MHYLLKPVNYMHYLKTIDKNVCIICAAMKYFASHIFIITHITFKGAANAYDNEKNIIMNNEMRFSLPQFIINYY